MIAYSAVPSTITRATITRTISVFCIEEEGPICLLIHQCHARHLYMEARRVINFQAAIASGIKKNGSVPELLLLACGSIWKENDSCNIFFADYYYFFGLFSSLDHCTFYKFGRSSILVPSLFLSKFAITRASLLS